MPLPTFTLTLPPWLEPFMRSAQSRTYPTDDSRMQVALALAAQNVAEQTGGPFGAAIFNLETGELVAPGINLVVPHNCALLHAEMVAIALAQQVWQTFDLGAEGLPATGLYTSAEPCAMCFGAIPWSGVLRVVCAAPTAEVQAIGFDEGPKLENWAEALTARGITVVQEVCRSEGAAILQAYAKGAGVIYNGRGVRQVGSEK
jgi:tRNA(Arg) A34 adenosine deaminase TadA